LEAQRKTPSFPGVSRSEAPAGFEPAVEVLQTSENRWTCAEYIP